VRDDRASAAYVLLAVVALLKLEACAHSRMFAGSSKGRNARALMLRVFDTIFQPLIARAYLQR
jgi:hypothetical protein